MDSRELQEQKDSVLLRLRGLGMTFAEIGRETNVTPGSAHRRFHAILRGRGLAPVQPVERPRPPETLIAWAAGFFDGEGCVFGYEGVQRGWRRFTFGLVVAQTVREPIDLLCQTWGGTVRERAPKGTVHSWQWVWSIRGREAAVFLQQVLPYLTVKAEEARTAIPCLFRTHQHGIPFSDAELTERRAAVTILAAAKKKGRRRAA